MTKEMVISANRHETKVAVLEDDQLVEVYFQRANEYSLAGSIHKGRVTRVLPGMQSAFVDLGIERDTFLYVSDFLEEHEDFDRITGDERPLHQERDRRPPPPQPGASAASQPLAAQDLAGPTVATAREAPAPPEAREAVASAPAAPLVERTDDRGDRRGRRSRRRRNRGRGFPDSKYAPEGGSRDAGPREVGPRPTSIEAEMAPRAEPAENS